MIPAAFDYQAPSTLDDAVHALSRAASGGEDVKIIAGGQSLLPVLRMRLADPGVIVDLGHIPELRGVRDEGDALHIGAMTTHHDVITNPMIGEHAALLARTTATIADPQIRHRGTFGGAIAHADPAGDLLAPALALEAEMHIVGPSGKRTVPASEFFLDLFTTALETDEVLTGVRVPKLTGWGAHYEKFNRVAQAWSVVAVAVAVRSTGGSIAEARVALTNMASVPVRARGVEQALVGSPATAEAISSAAQHAAEGTTPATDTNADAEYRQHLARVLTSRALTAAAGA